MPCAARHLRERRTPVLRLSGITKRFGPLLANDAIGFDLQRGEIVALLGENGAGKTTLMNILFGHYVADEGEIEAFGEQLPPGSPRAAIAAGIGMVHQHFTLADNLTVLDNIMLGTEAAVARRADTGARRSGARASWRRISACRSIPMRASPISRSASGSGSRS